MSSRVREDAQKASAAAKRLSDALRSDPDIAARLDALFDEAAARPIPATADDLKDPPGR